MKVELIGGPKDGAKVLVPDSLRIGDPVRVPKPHQLTVHDVVNPQPVTASPPPSPCYRYELRAVWCEKASMSWLAKRYPTIPAAKKAGWRIFDPADQIVVRYFGKAVLR